MPEQQARLSTKTPSNAWRFFDPMPDNSSADDDCLETGQAPTLIALQPDFLPNDWHGDKAPISMAIGAGQSHLIGKTLFETLGLTDA